MKREKYYFFWGGICSQWAEAPFKFNDVEYNCAEQFMMVGKAKVFNDEAMLSKIMLTPMPNEQKAFGRKVSGFNDEEWFKYATDIVTIGNVMKFTQNPDLFGELLEIKSMHEYAVEASPYDGIWGIKMGIDNPKILNEANWKGQNLLGKCIDKAYYFIVAEDEQQEFIDMYDRVIKLFE